MNREVFLSLLALDSYNREYGANVEIAGSSLGSARILDREAFGIDDNVYAAWQAAGFYGVAYEWNGQTVISYRGTNFEFASAAEFINSPLYNDVFGGWTLGGGFSPTSQGQPGDAIPYVRFPPI